MNLSFILDTIDNVKKLNQSKEFRQEISRLAGDGTREYSKIATDHSLPDVEKKKALWILVDIDILFRVLMIRYGREDGQKELEFPENPIPDRFLDWYFKLPLIKGGITKRYIQLLEWYFGLSLRKGGPLERYTVLLIVSAAADWVYKAIEEDVLKLPDILNDLGEIAASQRASVQEVVKDFAASLAPDTEIPAFSEDVAIERLANRLAKPYVAKANRDISDGESRWNDALEGVWKGTEALLRQPAMENFREAFAGSKLDNYLRKAIKNEFAGQIRKIERDRAKKKAARYTEIIEADLAPVHDNEGNLVSPLELIPAIQQEGTELMTAELASLDLSDTEFTICKLKLEDKTKKQIAEELGISRPTLNEHFKGLREKFQSYRPGSADIFRPGSIRIGKQWRPCPDPTPYMAMISIMRKKFLELLK